MSFESERLKFVPLGSEPAHLEGFHLIFSDERCLKSNPRGPSKSLEESQTRMNRILPSESNPNVMFHAIYLKDDATAEMIGIIGSREVTPAAFIDFFFAFEHWNKGYATEAAKAFVPRIWEAKPEATRLQAIVDRDNLATEKIVKKLGFKEVIINFEETPDHKEFGPMPEDMVPPLIYELERP